MSEDVLDGIGKLKSIHISETVLNVGVNNELGQTKDFSTQVEGISKTGLLPFLCCEGPGCSWSAIPYRYGTTQWTYLTGFKFML